MNQIERQVVEFTANGFEPDEIALILGKEYPHVNIAIVEQIVSDFSEEIEVQRRVNDKMRKMKLEDVVMEARSLLHVAKTKLDQADIDEGNGKMYVNLLKQVSASLDTLTRLLKTNDTAGAGQVNVIQINQYINDKLSEIVASLQDQGVIKVIDFDKLKDIGVQTN